MFQKETRNYIWTQKIWTKHQHEYPKKLQDMVNYVLQFGFLDWFMSWVGNIGLSGVQFWRDGLDSISSSTGCHSNQSQIVFLTRSTSMMPQNVWSLTLSYSLFHFHIWARLDTAQRWARGYGGVHQWCFVCLPANETLAKRKWVKWMCLWPHLMKYVQMLELPEITTIGMTIP